MALGLNAWFVGKCNTAIKYWETASIQQPNNMFVNLRLADALFISGNNIQRAVETYTSIEASPLLYNRGQVAEELGVIKSAIEQYKLSVLVSPSDKALIALRNIAIDYTVTGDFEAARKIWEFLIGATTDDEPYHWWAVAEIYKTEKEWLEAMYAYETGAKLSSTPYKFYLQAADVSKLGNCYTCAYEFYLHALDYYPDNFHIHLSLGQVAKSLQDYEVAIGWYQKAHVLQPESELPEYYQGILHFDQAEYVKAEEMFLQAFDKNPKNDQILFYLGLNALRQKNNSQAISYMEQAAQLEGEFYLKTLDELALLYWNAEEFNKSCQVISILQDFYSPRENIEELKVIQEFCLGS